MSKAKKGGQKQASRAERKPVVIVKTRDLSAKRVVNRLRIGRYRRV